MYVLIDATEEVEQKVQLRRNGGKLGENVAKIRKQRESYSGEIVDQMREYDRTLLK